MTNENYAKQRGTGITAATALGTAVIGLVAFSVFNTAAETSKPTHAIVRTIGDKQVSPLDFLSKETREFLINNDENPGSPEWYFNIAKKAASLEDNSASEQDKWNDLESLVRRSEIVKTNKALGTIADCAILDGVVAQAAKNSNFLTPEQKRNEFIAAKTNLMIDGNLPHTTMEQEFNSSANIDTIAENGLKGLGGSSKGRTF